MTQETWPYQGRQQHGEWGHGTAPHADKPARPDVPAPTTTEGRATVVAHGAVAYMPSSKAGSYEARLAHGMLGGFQKVVAAHPITAHLDDAGYRAQILDDILTPTATGHLRRAAAITHDGRTLNGLAPASEAMAALLKSAGLHVMGKGIATAANKAGTFSSREPNGSETTHNLPNSDNEIPDSYIQLAADQGEFHRRVHANMENYLRSRGAIVASHVGIQGYASDPRTGLPRLANIDMFVRYPGRSPFGIEIKTGVRPGYTEAQRVVYPQLMVGHAFSPDRKIVQFGFEVGEPLPPTPILECYQLGPSLMLDCRPLKLSDAIVP